jgi:quinol-cytochrome oxidoreductase complex cytochrome b subunit
MNRMFILKHKTRLAIALFLVIFCLFHYIKPSFAYGVDGEFRQFGMGYKHKTIVPVWAVVIALAIFSYLTILHLCY